MISREVPSIPSHKLIPSGPHFLPFRVPLLFSSQLYIVVCSEEKVSAASELGPGAPRMGEHHPGKGEFGPSHDAGGTSELSTMPCSGRVQPQPWCGWHQRAQHHALRGRVQPWKLGP